MARSGGRDFAPLVPSAGATGPRPGLPASGQLPPERAGGTLGPPRDPRRVQAAAKLGLLLGEERLPEQVSEWPGEVVCPARCCDRASRPGGCPSVCCQTLQRFGKAAVRLASRARRAGLRLAMA